LRIVEEELQKLDAFRESKRLMEEKIHKLEAEAEESSRRHKVELADLERHFLMDKAKTQTAFEDRIANLRAEEEMRLEAGRDAETKRIIKENKRFFFLFFFLSSFFLSFFFSGCLIAKFVFMDVLPYFNMGYHLLLLLSSPPY
jgi:hypothetical protein